MPGKRKPITDERKAFAIAIHSARIMKEISVTQIAYRVGIRRTTYQHYETAVAEPPFTVGMKICKELGLDPWNLVGGR